MKSVEETLNLCSNYELCPELESQLQKFHQREQILKEALEFYASSQAWQRVINFENGNKFDLGWASKRLEMEDLKVSFMLISELVKNEDGNIDKKAKT